MPSLETMLVDDTRIVESNDTTNVSEEEKDDTVYIDLTEEDTEQSISITLKHYHDGVMAKDDKYKCIIDANKPFWLLNFELTTWDTPNEIYFTFNGTVITKDQISKTPIELNMKDGDTIYVQGTIVLKEDISVNFMDEDGDVVTICGDVRHQTHILFDQYSAKKNMPLVLGRLIFHYSKQDGLPIQKQCQNSLAYLGISSGDTIYVVRKVPPPEDIDIIITDEIKEIREGVDPDSLVGQTILRDDSKLRGIIIETMKYDIGSVWVVEYSGGVKCQYTIEDITEGMQHYYDNAGVGLDLFDYIRHSFVNYRDGLDSLICEIGQLQNHGIDNEDKVALGLLKLEQELRRSLNFNMNIEPWTKYHPRRIQLGNPMLESLSNISAMKRSLFANEEKVVKPIIEAGELVFANSSDSLYPRWHQGIVKSYKEYKDIDGYGPRRTYSILLDNGDVLDDVEDYQVIKDKEYTLSKRIQESEWKGVTRVYDKESTDPWAREIGWYTVDIEGVEEAFEHLSYALRAYDINQAQIKGADLKESDLNIPWDWEGYFAERITTIKGDNSKDFHVFESALKEQIPLSICLFASYERIKDPFMKRLWKALIMSSQPNSIIVGELDPRRCWKEAYGHYLDGNLAQLKDSLYIFALRHICFENVSPIIFFMSFC